MNVFELIKEKLEKHIAETYYESVKGNRDAGVRNNTYHNAKDIVEEVEKEYNNGWIACSERLPGYENGNDWVSCIVTVIRSHYPTSTYDVCDSPYDEDIVMCAKYNVSQKIWHLDCDEQLNALIDIEDAPLNGDYVIAWQPLPARYKGGEQK